MSGSRSRLSDWAAWAEIVASVAVVVSLIYVGSEVGKNTKAVQGAAFQEIAHASDEYLLAIASDPALTAIFNDGNADPSAPTSTAATRHFILIRVYWRNMENTFLQFQRGLLGGRNGRRTARSYAGDFRPTSRLGTGTPRA